MSNQLVCPICQSFNINFLFKSSDKLLEKSNEIFCVYHCQACDTSSVIPQLSSKEIGKYYDDYYPDHKSITSLHLRKNLKSKLLSLPIMYSQNINPLFKIIDNYHKKGSLLEIGCGTGKFLYAAKKKGWKCSGIEMSKQASLFCQDQLYLDVQNELIENVSFPVNSFEVIVMSHVLEHLQNPHNVLEKIKTWLKEDGIIVLTVPNGNSWQRGIFKSLWYGYDIPRHYYTFGRNSLSNIFEQHNLLMVFDGTVYGTYSGFITSLLIAQKKYSSCWVNFLLIFFRNQLAMLLFTPVCFVIDRLGLGEALTVILRNKNHIKDYE